MSRADKQQEGTFVTFDGPNGVGKSSLLDGVADRLINLKFDILKTKEPTQSPLGQFVRNAEESYGGLTLACLVAADRYFHIENEILPAVKLGKIVLSDRYVESSLVLQRLDGLDTDFIWRINSQVYIPDLSIVFTAPAEILEQRLLRRNSFSRFERTKSRAEELNFYMEAKDFLLKHGFNVLSIDTGTTPMSQNVEKIVQKILTIISCRK